MRKPIIAGNWKMYKTEDEAKGFWEDFQTVHFPENIQVVICPPYLDIKYLVEKARSTNVFIGAQNVHYEKEGAFTGEVSVEMLKNAGVTFVIVGHSERRKYFGETDQIVNLKLKAVLENTNIRPILCLGESLEEREEGVAEEVVKKQLVEAFRNIDVAKAEDIVIAYEPIWAIGTGKTATSKDAQKMCNHIRSVVGALYSDSLKDNISILYGGSVKAENINEIMREEDIDGVLVGGASLDCESFAKIINFQL